MWFLFGVTSLISFSIYFGLKRHRNDWKGIPVREENMPYSYNIATKDNKTNLILLGCLSTCDIEFAVKKEGLWDRFFKAVGISVEFQVGHDSFDDELYVISDNTAVCATLAKSVELQEQIRKILKICGEQAVTLKGLFIQNKRIWVKLVPIDKKASPVIANLAQAFVPSLQKISEGFAGKLPPYPRGLKDPFFWRASLILAISTGMAATGLLHIFGLIYVTIPFTLDTHELMALSWVMGTMVIGGLAIITVMLLGRTARTHLVLIELLTIGYLGAFSSSVCLLRDANIEFDYSQGTPYVVEVHNKSISRGRRHTTYYLHGDDWLSSGQRRITVSSSMYRNSYVGEKLKVMQNPGWLRFRWISDITPVEWQSK